MTRATVFERDDKTLIFRTERGAIETLRKLGDFIEVCEMDVYDKDVDRLNGYYFYLHELMKHFSEEMPPVLQKEVMEQTGEILTYNLTPQQWGALKKGAGII